MKQKGIENMEKNIIELVTFENERIRFNLKHISELKLNEITVKLTDQNMINDCVNLEKEYLLSPESLKELVDLIDSGKYKTKLSTTSSKEFLKHHPTLESLKKSLAEREKLPKLGE